MVSQQVENSASANLRKTAQKERVRFTFEPDRHSPNGVTFTWLIHDAYEGKGKAAMAVRSFWLPIAYQESGRYSETELRQFAQDCVRQLESQTQFLRSRFNLTTQRTPLSIRPKSLPEGSQSTFLNAASAIDIERN